MVNTDHKYHQDQDFKVHIFRKCTLDILSDDLFDTTYFHILLVNSGSLSIQINETAKQLTACELIVIPTKASCKVLGMDNKLQVLMVLFTPGFAFKNSIRKSHIGYFEFFITRFPPKISLKRKEAFHMANLFKLLDRNNRGPKHLFQKEKLFHSFNLLVYEIAGIYFRYSQHKGGIRHTGKEKLTMRFFKILKPNCRKQHQVTFYADALSVTVGHLRRTIKEVTGTTAKKIIEEAIVLEAKILLRDSNLAISEIVGELEFSDFSFFGKFFKKHTSMSPSEYRSRPNF